MFSIELYSYGYNNTCSIVPNLWERPYIYEMNHTFITYLYHVTLVSQSDPHITRDIYYVYVWWHAWVKSFMDLDTLNSIINASFSFHKLIPKTLKLLPYILICHCTSISPWYIILDKKDFVKCFSSLSYIRRISGLFIANAMWTHWHVLSKM